MLQSDYANKKWERADSELLNSIQSPPQNKLGHNSTKHVDFI